MNITNQNEIMFQFDDIYGKYADAIFRFCSVRVSDREIALDLTQETFTRFWLQLSKDGNNSMKNKRAYIYSIAHNLIIDWYRKKKAVPLQVFTDEDTGEEKEFEQVEDGAAIKLELEAEGRFLLNSIGKLGQSYRNAIYLRFVEGLSPPEISEILGISVNATSVRINRGLEELRRITGYEISEKNE